jgi:ankyrin repeat protein
MESLVVSNAEAQRLPHFQAAMDLFAPHLPCDAAEMRRVYLRLALRYHPDKCGEAERPQSTQLFQAIAAAYEELLKPLGSSGEVRQRVKSPVAAAAELGDLEELRRLLEQYPSMATEEDSLGVYPLMFAACGGCIGAADLLLAANADVNALNPIKWSALLYGALGDHAPMMRFLVSRGAEVTAHELILAAYTGNSKSLEALLELYEGDVTKLLTDASKKNLLHLACEGLCFLKHSAERHAQCVDLVLTWKVPVDQAEPKRGRTCLQNLVDDVRWRTRNFEASEHHMRAVENLCLQGASVTVQDYAGNSALSIVDQAGLYRLREVLFSYM